MKKEIVFSGILIIAIICMITPAYASEIENLTAEVGSYYIKWSWDYNTSSNCSIWINGKFETDTSLDSFTLTNLNPRENHNIVLINTTNSSEIYTTSAARTFYPPLLFYLIFVFSIGFLLIEIFLKNATLTIIIGTLCFVMSILGFYMSYPYYFSILSYLMIGIAVIALLWCFMAAFSLLTKGDNEEENII